MYLIRFWKSKGSKNMSRCKTHCCLASCGFWTTREDSRGQCHFERSENWKSAL